MNSNPLVSILTPCYNSRKFLAETIESVLAQTYPNFEMILVDDGPPDTIEDIVVSFNSPKLHYYLIENGGPARARNFAARHSSGDFVAFLNHDDLWAPEKLEEQLEELERRNAVWIASGSQRINFYTNEVLENHQYKDYFKNVFYDILESKYLWGFSSVLIKKHVFSEVGMFNEKIWFMDDRDLYLRIAKTYPLAYLSKVHVLDKVHSSNITSSLSMEKMLDIHETLLNNARELDDNIPQRVIDNSKRTMYQTVCIEYLRANDVQNMRRMIKLIKIDLSNSKFLLYKLLSLLNDETIVKIMASFRKLRAFVNKSKVYPTISNS